MGPENFVVHLDEIRRKDGSIGKRIFVDHPQAAAVIPFVSNDEIIMVRQYRYALGRETLEIPAGKIDKGENPEECIKRELIEETGYDANRINWIFTYAPALGYSNELIHLFTGSDLKRLEQRIDENEISSLEVLKIDEVIEMIRGHEIVDSKTIIALCFTKPLV